MKPPDPNCPHCKGKGYVVGWTPSYNNPDNSGGAPDFVECDCTDEDCLEGHSRTPEQAAADWKALRAVAPTAGERFHLMFYGPKLTEIALTQPNEPHVSHPTEPGKSPPP